MSIDWIHFTPYSALAGGLLIGLSAALLFLFEGRIAGISGIVGGVLQRRQPGNFAWRIAFVAGLVFSPLLYLAFSHVPEPRIEASWGTLVVAGVLVGFGTRIGSGCTSGHGVCGLSRLSSRSFVATLTFMGAGFGTVYVVRHLFA